MHRESFTRDLVDTFITSLVTVVGLVVALHLLANSLGPESFGAYSLARRIVSTLDPIVTLTMGVAVTRYVALSPDERARHGYLLAGLFLGVAPSMLLLIIAFLWRHELSRLIFRSAAYDSLLIGSVFLLLGYSFFVVLYAFYRGRGEMRKANAWQLALIAIGPAAIASCRFPAEKVHWVVILNGLLCFGAVIPLCFHAMKSPCAGLLFLVKSRVSELLRYGLPRVPGGFAFPGILAIGPFLAPFCGSLKHAGYLLAGQSMLRVVEGATEAFGRVALPRLAKLSGTDSSLLAKRVEQVVSFSFHLGTFATLHLILWSDQLVFVLLGNQYGDATPVIRILMGAVLPFLAYSILRPVIDAIDARAINGRNACLAFLVTVLASALTYSSGLGAPGIAAATTLGLAVLGALTLAHLWKACRINRRVLLLRNTIVWNFVLITLSAVFKEALGRRQEIGVYETLLGSLVEACAFLFYLFTLWKSGAVWALELWRRLFPSPPESPSRPAQSIESSRCAGS